MPSTNIDIPGYVLRLEAVEEYGRSEQSFRRDFIDAQKKDDQVSLKQVKVCLNDGTLIEGTDISRGVVDQFNSEGKQPVWFMSRDLLKSRYWKKGKPPKERANNTRSQSARRDNESERQPPQISSGISMQNDVEFLKERIRTLEREKREEAERAEKREANLFAQLEVKDKQISAWDEITQGTTKGLATGRIAPQIEEGRQRDNKSKTEPGPTIVEADVHEPIRTQSQKEKKTRTGPSKKKQTVKHDKKKAAPTTQRKKPAKKQQAKKIVPKKHSEPAKPKGIFSGWFS